MRGIREVALNPEGEKPKKDLFQSGDLHYPHTYNPPHYNPVDPYNYPKQSAYNTQNEKDTIKIMIFIKGTKVGSIADEFSPDYDPNKANDKANILGQQKIKELLCQNYKEIYDIDTDIFEDYEPDTDLMGYEITYLLTPKKIKK